MFPQHPICPSDLFLHTYAITILAISSLMAIAVIELRHPRCHLKAYDITNVYHKCAYNTMLVGLKAIGTLVTREIKS